MSVRSSSFPPAASSVPGSGDYPGAGCAPVRAGGHGVVRRRRKRDGARGRDADRLTEHELVLSARVRKPGELCAVGRPDGAAVVRAGALREVSVVALLRRHRENFAPRLESRAHPARRERGAADHGGYLLELGSRPGDVPVFDGEPSRLPVLASTRWNVARLLVDDGVGAGYAVMMSKSSWRVSCVTCRVSGRQAKRFIVCCGRRGSRWCRPTHIGACRCCCSRGASPRRVGQAQ